MTTASTSYGTGTRSTSSLTPERSSGRSSGCSAPAGSTTCHAPTRTSRTSSWRTGKETAIDSGTGTLTASLRSPIHTGRFVDPNGADHRVRGPREFRHTLATLLNGMIEVGLNVIKLREFSDYDPGRRAGAGHMGALQFDRPAIPDLLGSVPPAIRPPLPQGEGWGEGESAPQSTKNARSSVQQEVRVVACDSVTGVRHVNPRHGRLHLDHPRLDLA